MHPKISSTSELAECGAVGNIFGASSGPPNLSVDLPVLFYCMLTSLGGGRFEEASGTVNAIVSWLNEALNTVHKPTYVGHASC